MSFMPSVVRIGFEVFFCELFFNCLYLCIIQCSVYVTLCNVLHVYVLLEGFYYNY